MRLDYEFFGNTKAFISLCRNVELLLDLSCVVSENGLKIEPVLLRKGSLYLARIKSSIIDLSAEVNQSMKWNIRKIQNNFWKSLTDIIKTLSRTSP